MYKMLRNFQKIGCFVAFLFVLTPFLMLLFYIPMEFFKSYNYLVIGVDYEFIVDKITILVEILGIILIALCVYRILKQRQIKEVLKKDNLVYLFFAIAIFFMLLSNFVNVLAETESSSVCITGDTFNKYLINFLIYFFVCSQIKEEKLKAFLIYAYVIISDIIAVFVMIDNIQRLRMFWQTSGVSAVFANSNHYGYFLAMSILLSFGIFILQKNIIIQYLGLFSAVLNVSILIINNTLGAYLAVFAGIIFFNIALFVINKKINKRAVICFIFFILQTIIMSFSYDTIFSSIIILFGDIGKIFENPFSEESEHTGSGRWVLWVNTLKYIGEKPILGWGCDGIAEMLEEAGGNSRPHNEILQYAANFGIPFAIIYLAGIFCVFRNAIKKKNSLSNFSLISLTAAFGYFISSLFGNVIFYTAPFFFIFLGLSFGIPEEK